MEFVTSLTVSNTYDSILVVEDRLIKMRYLIPSNTTTGSEELGRPNLHHVWKLQVLLNTIISEQGTQFTSNLWKHLYWKFGIGTQLLSAFHPGTNGQIERFN